MSSQPRHLQRRSKERPQRKSPSPRSVASPISSEPEVSAAEPDNAIAEEALPGETIEEWSERMTAMEEDIVEVPRAVKRPKFVELEDWDPWMGSL